MTGGAAATLRAQGIADDLFVAPSSAESQLQPPRRASISPRNPDARDPSDYRDGRRAVIESIRLRAAEVLDRFPRPMELPERTMVTTGQQVGIFTGPLLTMVKATAVLGLCRDLEREGVRTEPCFWCASEDHDLVEVTRVFLPGPNGPHDVGPPAGSLARNRRPVGALVPDIDLRAVAEAAIDGEQDAPFADEARALAALGAGQDFLGGFVASLSWLLDDTSLRFLDAARIEDKPKLVPLALRLIRERGRVREILSARARALEAEGRTLQVRSEPSALPLFAIVGGARCLIREEGDRFSLKGEDDPGYSEEDVVSRLESGEWHPSFSALSRPLAASTLHPIAATVLGPAEIAYWDQMLPLFDWAGLVPPVILPRPAVVLLDQKARRLLERSRLPLPDLLTGPEEVRRKRGAEREGTLLGGIDRVERTAAEGLESLRGDLVGLDPTLGKGLDATLQNVRFAAGKLRERVIAASSRADEAFGNDLDRLAAAVLPGGKLAERVYSPLVYVPRHGRGALAGGLKVQLRWDQPGPQVIDL